MHGTSNHTDGSVIFCFKMLTVVISILRICSFLFYRIFVALYEYKRDRSELQVD